MYKKRGYKRDTPFELLRDYKLFAIACEGSKTEPKYFNLFRHISPKITVDVIEEIGNNETILSPDPAKSAPRWVLDRAIKYIEKEGLSDEDDLWFVMDVDKWKIEQLRELAEYCKGKKNWYLALSNPCFEVWLYFHKNKNINKSHAKTPQEFKTEISTLEKGGYSPYTFIENLDDAILNAKAADSDKRHFFPNPKETKVYLLAEALLKALSKKKFEIFIKEILPQLVLIEKEKLRKKRSAK